MLGAMGGRTQKKTGRKTTISRFQYPRCFRLPGRPARAQTQAAIRQKNNIQAVSCQEFPEHVFLPQVGSGQYDSVKLKGMLADFFRNIFSAIFLFVCLPKNDSDGDFLTYNHLHNAPFLSTSPLFRKSETVLFRNLLVCIAPAPCSLDLGFSLARSDGETNTRWLWKLLGCPVGS